MKTITTGEFKAKCLALLNEVNESHETIVVTKRGVPVAKLSPVSKEYGHPPSLIPLISKDKRIVCYQGLKVIW
jgi:prevent-host-death family protein